MNSRPEFHNPQNWSSRGYLPHYDSAQKYQMITYRLADSLPREVLKRLEESLAGSADGSSANIHAKTRSLIELYLDRGNGSCVLRIPQVAKIVVDNWHFFDKEHYDLIAYVVMPNHVHLLIKTYEGYTLGKIVQSWKSYTSHKINTYLRYADEPSALPGNKIWQEDYWDRFIRDEKHFASAVNYILENPVKTGLVSKWQDWPWSYVRDVNAERLSALPGEQDL